MSPRTSRTIGHIINKTQTRMKKWQLACCIAALLPNRSILHQGISRYIYIYIKVYQGVQFHARNLFETPTAAIHQAPTPPPATRPLGVPRAHRTSSGAPAAEGTASTARHLRMQAWEGRGEPHNKLRAHQRSHRCRGRAPNMFEFTPRGRAEASSRCGAVASRRAAPLTFSPRRSRRWNNPLCSRVARHQWRGSNRGSKQHQVKKSRPLISSPQLLGIEAQMRAKCWISPRAMLINVIRLKLCTLRHCVFKNGYGAAVCLLKNYASLRLDGESSSVISPHLFIEYYLWTFHNQGEYVPGLAGLWQLKR